MTSPPSPSILSGLLPQYTLVREIGRGEYGVVHLARRGDAWYAVKVVRRPAEGDVRPFERELRGVRTVRRLPPLDGLVRIHDVDEAPDGTSFAYAMDLADPELDGPGPGEEGFRPRTLASVVAAEVALPLRECLDIGIRIASVLAQLQRRHIVHRDIKPGNIIFVWGRAVLADVGLAVDDRDAALALKGARLFVPRADFPALPEGEYYWVDLIGLRVVNREGAELGEVQGVMDNGAQAVLIVRTIEQGKERERLIPFVGVYIDDVRLDEGVIAVDWQADY